MLIETLLAAKVKAPSLEGNVIVSRLSWRNHRLRERPVLLPAAPHQQSAAFLDVHLVTGEIVRDVPIGIMALSRKLERARLVVLLLEQLLWQFERIRPPVVRGNSLGNPVPFAGGR